MAVACGSPPSVSRLVLVRCQRSVTMQNALSKSRHLGARVRLIAVTVGVAVGVALSSPAPPAAKDTSDALRQTLAAKGLSVEAVHWVDAAPNFTAFLGGADQTAWVSARRADAPRDVYLVRARLTPEGRVWEVKGVYNVTQTAAADEGNLVCHGHVAAWTLGDAGQTYTVHVAALAADSAATRAWSPQKRVQHAVTNWQTTGSRFGTTRYAYKLDPPASSVTLAVTDDRITLRADDRETVLPAAGGRPLSGGEYVQDRELPLAEPGSLVTWAVDTLRQVEWFGSDKMQLLKAVAYQALDVLRRHGSAGAEAEAEDISADHGADHDVLEALPATPDPETGWPPPPVPLVLPPAFEGEGQWLSLRSDEFVRSDPALPETFVTTFLRTDKERKFSRIDLAAWDPRLVELHVMTGTEEPKSATGETGSGLIPRDPAVMTRVVGAFNGGFQTTHGAFGIKAEGTLYVPAIAYAATIAHGQDGSTLFGNWPLGLADSPDLIGFRQNLSPLIGDGTFNPYGRVWWGGVPEGWEDDTRTVRSGLCVTKRQHIVYFYGSSVDHKHLAKAMSQVDCSYGLHLDMNQGHTGLEFYRIAAEADLPLLPQRLDKMWQSQGAVEGLPGYRFRGRRLIRSMRLMNFPRYIKRQSRDFFYLTLRHLLPGPALGPSADNAAAQASPSDPGQEGMWQVRDLPQHGYPYAIATTQLRPDPSRPQTKVRLAKLDGKYLQATTELVAGASVVATLPPGAATGVQLFLQSGVFATASQAPENNPAPLVSGLAGDVAAAFGAGAPDGMLYYAEVVTGRVAGADRAVLESLLRRLGCTEVLGANPGSLAVGGTRDLSGHPLSHTGATYLLRVQGPGSRTLFPETPIVPREVWQPILKAAEASQ